MDVNFEIYVFTTKFVIRGSSPVVYVAHDLDGDWQFLGGEEGLEEKDALLISLGEMLEFDPTLQSVLTLSIGQEAIRTEVGGSWKIVDI